MRCVLRGAWPQDDSGAPIQFARYQDAAPYLKDRMGRFCSFCERWIATQLAVEHKRPKHAYPDLERSWENFLLACANCNSVKGTKDFAAGKLMWPDEDDTFGTLEYRPSGRIVARSSLSAATRAQVEATLALVGLDREPPMLGADHRWMDRLEIWRLAEASRIDLQERHSDHMRKRICATAVAKGGFSIWMTVFADDPTMQQALIDAFPGTVMRNAAVEKL